jgi:hypothetical protein
MAMLKKGQPIHFTRPVSTMRVVLLAVEQGHQYRHDILSETKLKFGQVASALYNLVYVGAVKRETDKEGRSIYVLPGKVAVAKCLCGVRSIFDVR